MPVSFWLEEFLDLEEQEEAGGVHKRSKLKKKNDPTSNPWNRMIFIFGFEYQLMKSMELAVYDSVN